jgi:transcriptional regulator GlxA family with amidase domain
MQNSRCVNTLPLSQSSQQIAGSRRIGFLVYPGCEILDVCGPYDVFFYADTWLTRFGRHGETGYQCFVIAAVPGPVRTKCGIEILPTRTFDQVGENLDTLVVAGGCTSGEEASRDPTLVEWVRSMAPRTRRMASICTGAFILAAAGLLNHRRVTTHWLFSELLAATFPLVDVDCSRLFTRDGNIYSSGGVTAGIDLALALVEEDLGQAITLTVARTMVVFPHRPGGQFRGRDAHCWTPPAQIRASPIRALGSYLGCLTANRALGQGCSTRGFGRNSLTSSAIRSHPSRTRWLRRRSCRYQRLTMW